jgi:hypothetical protein
VYYYQCQRCRKCYVVGEEGSDFLASKEEVVAATLSEAFVEVNLNCDECFHAVYGKRTSYSKSRLEAKRNQFKRASFRELL